MVSFSSVEVKYKTMLKMTNELIKIKGILKDFGIETTTPMTMHYNNQTAIQIASKSVFFMRRQNIEVDCHKVRYMIVQGVILPCYT